MGDAPERLWAVTDAGMVGTGRWVTQGTENPHGNVEYVRADLYEQVKRERDAARKYGLKSRHRENLAEDARIHQRDRASALEVELEQVKQERDDAKQALQNEIVAHGNTIRGKAERLDGARVKVKPLNWEVIQGHSGIWWRASNPFGGLPYEALSESDKERHQADYERRILSALAEPAGEAEPDFAASIAEVIKEESLNEAACGWRPCTGCHETNEGYETGRYSYSTMFGCHVGHGCSECGGLGVVWEYWSKDTLDDMARDITTPPGASAIRGAAIQLLSAIDTGCGRDEIISQTGPLRAVLAGAKP